MSNVHQIENPIYALVAEYSFIGDNRIEKQIARITLANISRISSMTVEKMADLCGVSESTYLRFCRKIGYSSFTEFKIRITDTLQKYLFVNTPFSEKENFSEDNFFIQSRAIINHDIDLLEQHLDRAVCKNIVQLMAQSSKIYVIDLFYSTVRFALHSDLSVTGKEVVFLRPSSELIKIFEHNSGEKSMAFMVYDGQSRTKDIPEVLPVCRAKKITTAIMSCVSHFPGDQLCDELLFIGKAESAVSSVTIHDLTFQYLSTLYRKMYIR